MVEQSGCLNKMEQKRRYTNYRFSNYMQEGVAVLKITPTLENISVGKRNTIHSIPSSSKVLSFEKTDSNSVKNKYHDKPIKTTKNFIGKSCYNVGSSVDV